MVDALIAMISREGYVAGALLPPERELCARFGVSRTVIREALQVLATRGIVTIRRGTGVTVGNFTGKPVLDYLGLLLHQQGATLGELLELRRLLEVEIAGLAAARSTPEDHAAMAHALQVMHDHPDTAEGNVDADVRFHQLIVQAAHNRLFETILQPIANLLRASRIASTRSPITIERAIHEHDRILVAITAHDVEEARSAMRAHLDHTEHDFDPVHFHTTMGAAVEQERRDG